MISPRRVGLCILVGVAFSAACTCPGPPCILPLAGIDAGVALDHTPTTVRMTQPLPYGCDDEDVNVERVTAEVRDEANQSIPAQVTHSKAAQQLDIDVSFETREPGWYYVRTQVEPALATIQGDVLVARNRLAVEPISTALSCSRAYLTTSSTYLCDAAAYRDGGVVPGLSATVADVRGDVIWAWDNGLLSRWQDSASGPSLSPATRLAMQQKPAVIISSADGLELYGATFSNAFRVVVRSGALIKLSEPALEAVMTPDLAFASNGTLFIADAPATATVLAKTKVCSYSLANDLVTKIGSCDDVTGLPLGVVDDALWIREEGFLKAMQGDALTGKLVTVLTLRTPAIPARPTSAPLSTVLEVSSGGHLAARLQNGLGYFDRYRSLDISATTVGGSSSAVFFSGSSGTRIFAR